MFKKKFYFIFLLIICSKICSETSLDYFQYLILDKHPMIKALRINQKIEENKIDINKDIKNEKIQFKPYLTHEKPISNQNMAPISLSSAGIDISKSQLVLKNGADLSMNYSFLVIDQESNDFKINNESYNFSKPISYQNKFAVQYSVPLSKNKYGVLSKYPYLRQINSSKIAQLQMLENIQSFLVQKSIDYLEWVYLYHQYLIALDQKKIMKEQLQTIERRLKQNLVEKIDFLRAEDAYRNAERELVLIYEKFQAQGIYLSEICQNENFLNKIPSFSFFYTKDINNKFMDNLTASFRITKEKRLLNDQLEEDIKTKQEELKNIFNLNLEAGLQAETSKINFDLFPQNPMVSASVFYEIKQKNIKGIKELENLRLTKTSLELNYTSKLLDKNAHIKKLIKEIESTIKVIKINQKNKESALLTYKEEKNRYETGVGDLRFVIAAKENQNRVNQMLNENYFMYHSLYLQFLAACDQLVVQ